MRTTLSISDEVLIAAKRRARERGQSLGALVDMALQRELSSPSSQSTSPAVPVFRGGTGPRPGVDLNSNRAMFEAMDEGVDLNDRR